MLAGDKSSDKRWYEKNIPIAEKIFAAHLETLKRKDEEAKAKEKRMKTHDEYMNKLSPERQAKIKVRTQQLIAEELTLRDLRKALQMSQETVAELLGMRQGDLSKFERRSDAYLSTIRRYVEAMGGTLDLVAQFPNRVPVRLVNIGDLFEDETECKSRLSSNIAAGPKRSKRATASVTRAKRKR